MAWTARPSISMTSGLAFLAVGSSLTSGERAARCLRLIRRRTDGVRGARDDAADREALDRGANGAHEALLPT